jgi:DNA-directed RNA polymerase subunit alpha
MLISEAVTPRIETAEQSDTYGKFTVEPLEPGYGVTLGNSLRRVLLSSIVGAAITSIKIEGVQHEFQTIPGIKEDATELLLNLKELFVKVYDNQNGDNGLDDGTRIIRVEARGAGRITGADVICPSDVEIANPEVHIATISDETASLFMELTVEKGRGYVMPEKSVNRNEVIGQIPVPAAFGPIRKVNYQVDPTRVGNRTDYERLVIDVHYERHHRAVGSAFSGGANAVRVLPAVCRVPRNRRTFLPPDSELLGCGDRRARCPYRGTGLLGPYL